MTTQLKMFPTLRISKDVEQEIMDAIMTHGQFELGTHCIWESELRDILNVPISMPSDDFSQWDEVSKVLQFSHKVDAYGVEEYCDFLVVILDKTIEPLRQRAEEKKYIYDTVDDNWY